MGNGPSQQSVPPFEAKPEPTTAKAPRVSIHNAAFSGNIEAVKEHIAAGTDVNAKIRGGSTPLYEAASRGHKEITDLLIANGADLNAKKANEDGGTPLDRAIEFKRTETGELLCKHGG